MLLRSLTRAKTLIKPSGCLQRFTTISISNEPIYQSHRYTPTLKSQPSHHQPHSIHHPTTTPAHTLLVRAGFLRQSSNGIWNLLPNSIRVLKKLENIVREEMESIGASEVSLSHIQTSTLWKTSGRWDHAGKELFRLSDRKEVELLLAPTHEEEITQLIKQDVISSKQLPVRLFHIGRKYRDELRPRAGLLRSREFIMKDLYTFDLDAHHALDTYKMVQGAYEKIFQRIGIPFVVAEADSGTIGGSRSHEYQYKSTSGEDTVINCTRCEYKANVELAKSIITLPASSDLDSLQTQFYQTGVKKTLVAVVLPRTHHLNHLKLSKIYPGASELKLNELTDLDERFEGLEVVVDESCKAFEVEDIYRKIEDGFLDRFRPPTLTDTLESPFERSPLSIWSRLPTYSIHDIRQVRLSPRDVDSKAKVENDLEERCPKCDGPLESSRAIEVAHTFYLGTKYSSALSATCQVSDPQTGQPIEAALEMGCYGIGISRLIGAIAEVGHVKDGLRWPLNVAPFKVCIVIPPLDAKRPTDRPLRLVAHLIAQAIEGIGKERRLMEGEVLIDDRNQRIGWKLMDSDLVGYPMVIVLGNGWMKDGKVEIRDVRRGETLWVEKVEVVEGRLLGEDRLREAIESLI